MDSQSSITRESSSELAALRAEVAARIAPIVRGAEACELEQRCRVYLQTLRWPAGVECPRCEERARILWLASRAKWHCYSCRYQFSVTAGTLFHHSHLEVWKWLGAVHLMLDSPDGISAGELRRRIGGSYKTAWFAAHRIRAAMRGRGHELLRSLVEAELGQAAASAAPLLLAESRSAPALAPPAELPELASLAAGPHQHLSAKHLVAYLDERRWRFAQRGNPQAFRDTVVALLRGEGLSYLQLVAGR